MGSVPLKIQFPTLYSFCEDPNVSAAESWEDGEWVIDFRRTLTIDEAGQRAALFDLLNQVHLDESSPDVVECALDKSKCFTTKSPYRFLSYRGVSIARRWDNHQFCFMSQHDAIKFRIDP
jgi:hypothetical protein